MILKKETRIGLVIVQALDEKNVALILILRGKIIEGVIVTKFKNIFELASSIISSKYYGELRYIIMMLLNIHISEVDSLFLRILKPIIVINKDFSLENYLGLNPDECQSLLNYFIKNLNHDILDFSLKLINQIVTLLKTSGVK
ncbi:MAG: hypothetical protein DRO23_03320 [Thermoprotei archaeon]|nr:MAG: hypothetical protein DRO23_03320 [Thermoprotei archaeon]